MLNIFGLADDILIAGFDEQGRDHDAMLDKVLRIYRQENMKLNKDKCLFRCIRIPFFGEIISEQGGKTGSQKSTSTNIYSTTKNQEGISNISVHTKLPK